MILENHTKSMHKATSSKRAAAHQAPAIKPPAKASAHTEAIKLVMSEFNIIHLLKVTFNSEGSSH